MKSNLQSTASRESNEEENIQEFAPKAVQTEFSVFHAFERDTAFWLNVNLKNSNLASRELRGEKI